MRIESHCILCTFNRGIAEVEQTDAPEHLKRRALIEVLNVLKRCYEEELTPAEMGTNRYDTIERVINIKKSYRGIMEKSDEKARQILEKLKLNLESSKLEERFDKAFLWAAAANSMDFGVLDHTFSISDFEGFLDGIELAVDDRDVIFKALRSGSSVTYLLDNAGEIVFDTLLIEVIKEMKNEVILGVKRRDFQNDVTYDDLSRYEISRLVDSIITTEASFFGLGEEDVEKISSTDLIIAKGMGNFEVLEEKIHHGIIFTLTAKCIPVASKLNVKRGKAVILFRR